jgi:hypothetical protein
LETAKKRKSLERFLLFVLILFGYLLRLIDGFNATVSRDGITYIQHAIQWEKTGVLSFWRFNGTILFIELLKIILKFGVDPITAGFSLNIVFGTFFIFLIISFL